MKAYLLPKNQDSKRPKLKVLLTCILTLTTAFLFGQESNDIFSFGDNELQSWTYQDFIKNNIKKIEGYSILIKKNGKVSTDSLLLFKQEIDRDSNKVFGRTCSRAIPSHAPSFWAWSSIQTFYDKNGHVVKEIDSPDRIEMTKSDYGVDWKSHYSIATYKYDSSGNLTSENYQHFQNSYTVFKHSIDTSHYYTVESKIYEYNYNDKGQRISSFYTDDSTRYLPTKSYKPDSNSVKCFSCQPSHLKNEWTYDENGKIKTWISYTREGKFHTKRYYYYDHNGKLKKKVDSTGWYFTTILPYCESTTDYEYSDTGRTEINIYSTGDSLESNNRTIKKFNNKNQITSECSLTDSEETCTTYFYNYKNGKLFSAISIENDKMEVQFQYTPKGLIYERKEIFRNKIHQLTRYYYE